MSDRAPFDLAVVGAGLTGLSAAWRAHREGRSVVLLEASPRVGGVLRTDRVGAYRVERAAGAFPSSATALLELHAALPGAPAVHRPPAEVGVQLVATRSGLVRLPRTPQALLASPLLGIGAKARLFAELARGPRRTTTPETAYGFVRRRFGAAVAERFLRPMTLGIYGTSPEDLGLADAFPTLPPLERSARSLVRHLIRLRGAPPREIWTFEGGMEGFPRAIAADLGDRVRTGSALRSIEHGAGELTLRTGSGEAIRARQLVLALPAGEQARLIVGLSPSAAGILGAVTYVPMVVASVGLPPDAARVVPRAFGFLRAPGSPLRILGASFPSNLDPAVAPPGHALANVFLGGSGDPEALSLSDDELSRIIAKDLGQALGGPIRPDLVTSHRWPRAIPVLSPGHRARMAEAGRLLAPFGVRLSGSHVTGVGVHACVSSRS